MKRFAMLRGRIVEKFGTMTRFAEAVGMSKAGLSIKLSRGTFTAEQMSKWASLLEIPNEQIAAFFLQ